MGDTHCNVELMRSAAALLRDLHKARVLVHLGDYYRDAVLLRREGYTIWCVPGLQCPSYGTKERILRESLAGVRIVAAHTPDDLDPEARDADLALHGHTHVPYVEQRGNTIWLNPGHLKSALDRGQRPSYAVVQLEPGLVHVSINGIDGELRASETFRIGLATAHG